ncbi:MAG: hypothetical protein ABT940_11650, partial [Alphaproteobacteria bacterium]
GKACAALERPSVRILTLGQNICTAVLGIPPLLDSFSTPRYKDPSPGWPAGGTRGTPVRSTGAMGLPSGRERERHDEHQ